MEKTNLPLPLALDTKTSHKRLWLILGLLGVIVVGVIAVMFGGGGFKGDFAATDDAALAKLTLTAEAKTDGVGATAKKTLTYTFTNGSDTDFSQKQTVVVRYYVQNTTTNKFNYMLFRPLNSGVSFRAGESVTFNAALPQGTDAVHDVAAYLDPGTPGVAKDDTLLVSLKDQYKF